MGPVVALAALAALLWIFWTPIQTWVDSVRLPEVEVARVYRSDPAAAGAVAGTAANGYVVARTRAALSADTPGRVVEINVEEGQVVEKGFLVARLYDEEFAAMLRRAEAELAVGKAALHRHQAELAAAEADLERLGAARTAAAAAVDVARSELRLAELHSRRVNELLEGGAESVHRGDEVAVALETATLRVASTNADLAASDGSLGQGRARVDLYRAAVEEARAQVDALRAAREHAEATLQKTEVRAPFNGVVVLKDAEVGEVVSPNSQAGSSARGSVATMVDLDSLEAQAEVPEMSLPNVTIGAPAQIFLDAYPGTPYAGRVDRIWPTADRQKATVEVRIAFEALDSRLRPEMGVRVVFLDPDTGAPGAEAPPDAVAASAVLVPEDALVPADGQHGVFVLERDTVRFAPLELGARRGGRVIVHAGLAGNEEVVRNPPATLASGDRVRRAGS